MWSILPNTAAVYGARLGAEDLGHRREADLELLGARLLGRQQALDLAAGGVEGLGERLAVVAVAPGEHLDRERGAARPTPARVACEGLLDQALEQDRAGGREQHHRDDQVGAAAVVLFGDRGDVLDPLLVGGDRLVLDAVVGGEVAVHQRDERRGSRRSPGAGPRGSRVAGPRRRMQAGDRQGRGGGDEDARVLEGQAGRAHPPAHQRQHQHRLGEFDRAAQAGDLGDEVRDQLRLAFGGDFDRAVRAADRGGPVGRAVDQQAVAQRHPAEPQLLACDSSSPSDSR